MHDTVSPGPLNGCNPSVREAVCVHTNQIYDSCRAKECLEDLRVYPTRASQEILDSASSVKCKCSELIWTYIDVQEVSFNRGFYAVDIKFFYRIVGEAYGCSSRPQEVVGLATYEKRVILFGSEGNVRIFNSKINAISQATNMPTAIVEAVDPICLNMKLVEPCECRCANDDPCEVPGFLNDFFCDELVVGGECKRWFVTLGQFSIVRLERDSQLLIPSYDFCMPSKECAATDSASDNACDLFRQIKFPVEQFFPPNCSEALSDSDGHSNCRCK